MRTGGRWRLARGWWVAVRRTLMFVVVVVLGGLTVGAVHYLLQADVGSTAEQTGACDPTEVVVGAEVRQQVKVEVDRLEFPRVSNTVEIRVPAAWTDARCLLAAPASERYRSALRHLIGRTTSTDDLGVSRHGRPTVTVADGVLTVRDHSWVDVTGPGAVTFSLLALSTGDGHLWSLTVVPTPELDATTSWDVEVSAPPGWLAGPDPSPWPPTRMSEGRLNWTLDKQYIATPADDRPLVSVDLVLDPKARFATTGGTTFGQFFFLGNRFLEMIAFPALILLAVGMLRRRATKAGATLNDVARTARRATLPMLWVPVVPLSAAIARLVLRPDDHDAPGAIWWTLSWAVDIAVVAAVLFAAWRWWLPRTVVLVALVVDAGILTLVPLLSDIAPFHSEVREIRAVLLGAEVLMVYTVVVLALAGLSNAVRVLLAEVPRWNRRPPRKRRLPGWLWSAAGGGGALFVLERYWTATANVARNTWLDAYEPVREYMVDSYRYYLWGMLDDSWQWILPIAGGAALWLIIRTFLRRVAEPLRRDLVLVAVLLLAVGSTYWTVWLAWIELPVWLLTMAILFAWQRVFTSVLDRTGKDGRTVRSIIAAQDVEMVRTHATQWIRSRSGTTPAGMESTLLGRITPMDIVLSLGPGRTPYRNMIKMCRLAVGPGVICGLVLVGITKITSTSIANGYPDSFAADYVETLVWEMVKWLFGAAAIGVLWHHLPGRRGPTKVLPVVLAYVAGPLGSFTTALLVDGRFGLVELIDVTFFALVMVTAGLLMDLHTLRELDESSRLTRQEISVSYGVGNLASRLTVVLAPLTAALAIVGTLFAGPQDLPSDRGPGPSVQSPSR